eukprot:s2011_g13.t3
MKSFDCKMPLLLPGRVNLPDGPLVRRPSELLAAFVAGQQSKDRIYLLVIGILVAVLVATAVAAVVLVRRQQVQVQMPELDLEAQLQRFGETQASEREEVYTSLAATNRRLDIEVQRRSSLERFVESSCDEVAPKLAEIEANVNLALQLGHLRGFSPTRIYAHRQLSSSSWAVLGDPLFCGYRFQRATAGPLEGTSNRSMNRKFQGERLKHVAALHLRQIPCFHAVIQSCRCFKRSRYRNLGQEEDDAAEVEDKSQNVNVMLGNVIDSGECAILFGGGINFFAVLMKISLACMIGVTVLCLVRTQGFTEEEMDKLAFGTMDEEYEWLRFKEDSPLVLYLGTVELLICGSCAVTAAAMYQRNSYQMLGAN